MTLMCDKTNEMVATVAGFIWLWLPIIYSHGCILKINIYSEILIGTYGLGSILSKMGAWVNASGRDLLHPRDGLVLIVSATLISKLRNLVIPPCGRCTEESMSGCCIIKKSHLASLFLQRLLIYDGSIIYFLMIHGPYFRLCSTIWSLGYSRA